MEGFALLLCFRSGLIRASSKRPNRNHIITFILKVTILAKAINRDKPFCPPGFLSTTDWTDRTNSLVEEK